jgi:manganese transport protein
VGAAVITRTLAIVPAILIIGIRGEGSVTDLLTLSQSCSPAVTVRHVSSLALHQFTKRMGAWMIGGFLLAAVGQVVF